MERVEPTAALMLPAVTAPVTARLLMVVALSAVTPSDVMVPEVTVPAVMVLPSAPVTDNVVIGLDPRFIAPVFRVAPTPDVASVTDVIVVELDPPLLMPSKTTDEPSAAVAEIVCKVTDGK
jgi:hypothetical protein